MNKVALRTALFAALCAWALVSVYIYSRFTVDDAFITWRYGKNLVEHHVWNYNPSLADPTQAYTNPIYALLGIVPHLLGCDVVLFFKLFSLALYGLAAWWVIRLSGPDRPLAVLLLGLPATVVHAFGGLETLLYVFLTAMLLVELVRGRYAQSLACAALLFLVRPESWVLALTVPVCWIVSCPPDIAVSARWKRGLLAVMLLGVPLAAYFTLHHHLFGEFLPNTFYAKAKAIFKVRTAIVCCVMALPLLGLLGRRTLGPAIVAGVLFGGMALSYSTSQLQMNYAGRFFFHLFFPAFCLGLYLRSERRSHPVSACGKSPNFAARAIHGLRLAGTSRVTLLAVSAAFISQSGLYPDYCNTYYQRALAAHAALGKELSRVSGAEGIRGLAVGDAGMIAYHSSLPVLDTVGLGSRLLTKFGPSRELYEAYGLDLVLFFTKEGKVDRQSFNQGKLLDWAEEHGMRRIGDLYWQDDYALAVYARRPIPSLAKVFEASKQANVRVPPTLLQKMLLSPPWHYWHE